MTKNCLFPDNIVPVVDATVTFGGVAVATRLAGVH